MPGAACLITLTLIARLSWYDPGLCAFAPINCFDPASPFHMASGEDARDWYGRVLACPPEDALGVGPSSPNRTALCALICFPPPPYGPKLSRSASCSAPPADLRNKQAALK